MSAIPACPQCTLENTYPDGDHFVCADCGHEWSATEAAGAEDEADAVVKDAILEGASKVSPDALRDALQNRQTLKGKFRRQPGR